MGAAEKVRVKRRYGWTAEDDEFLRSNFRKLPVKEIARRLGRSRGSVRTRVKRKLAHLVAVDPALVPVRKERTYRPWTKKEERRLFFEHESYTIDALAERFGRTRISMANKLREKGWKAGCAYVSLNEAARRTGYDRKTLLAAIQAKRLLGNKRGRKHGARKSFMLTEDDLEALTNWIRDEYQPKPQPGFWRPKRDGQGYEYVFPSFHGCTERGKKTRPLFSNGFWRIFRHKAGVTLKWQWPKGPGCPQWKPLPCGPAARRSGTLTSA